MSEHEVKIRIGSHTYFREVPSRTKGGDPVRKIAVARQGETITVDDEEYERGQDLDAFGDPEAEAAASASDPSSFNAALAGEDELVEYLRENEPNVADTVALAGDDPDVALRVLRAEESLAAEEGEEPREGVRKKLEKLAE